MKLVKKTDLALGIPEKYKSSYFRDGVWDVFAFNPQNKYELLIAEPNLTNEKANSIIGNNSWSDYECSNCRKAHYNFLVEIDSGDDEYPATRLCAECCGKHIREIEELLLEGNS